MAATKVEAGPQGPALTDDEALLQALRTVWPILSAAGRRQAIDEAKRIKDDQSDRNAVQGMSIPVTTRSPMGRLL